MRPLNPIPRFNGARIARSRKAHGMTQEELAKAVDMTRYQIIRIERGESGSLDSLSAICTKLDLSMTEVFAPDAPQIA